MKTPALVLLLSLTLLRTALAADVPKEEVSADAKWLLHLEAAQFRSTRVGAFVTTQMLEKKLAGPVAELNAKFKLAINVEKILDGINSFTLYGTDYQSVQNTSVLLIRANPEIEQVVVGLLAGLALSGTNTPIPVFESHLDNLNFYDIHGVAYCAILPGKVIAVGRTRDITANAAQVLTGKAPNLSSSTNFTEFGDPKQPFFFLGVAEGFNFGNGLPPEARLLQAADGGRVTLGEDAGNLFLHLALHGKTPDVVAQMQQVVQGLIAIGALAQPQDKDVARLLHSINVSSDAKLVNISVDYPVSRAIEQLAVLASRVQSNRSAPPSAGGTNAEAPEPPPLNAPPSTH